MNLDQALGIDDRKSWKASISEAYAGRPQNCYRWNCTSEK